MTPFRIISSRRHERWRSNLQRNNCNSKQGFVKLADGDTSASIPMRNITCTRQSAADVMRKNRNIANPQHRQDQTNEEHDEW
jgi:hypothetical protein